MSRSKLWKSYAIGLSAWLIVVFAALSQGAVEGAALDIILEVRLPRVILATAVGFGLSVAGTALQALFSNPLCEPYTLGISSGAALGAVLGASLGLNWVYSGIALSAFAGALFFAAILYAISLKPGVKNVSLLLAGVMLGFLGSSLVAVWMAMSDTNGLQGALIWLFGDLSRARLNGSLFTFVSVLGLSSLIWLNWRGLDALLMGEENAAALGVNVAQLRRRLIVLTSFLIGICVSAGGVIGFVGLIVPHIGRKSVGSFHLNLLPVSMIWGGAVLVFADLFSRVLIRPYELPVGIVTGLIGAPAFLWIMLNRQNTVSQDST
jgi:iron complex transport system permease protein